MQDHRTPPRNRPPTEGKHQIVVRLPLSLHARLTELATDNGLSVNGQVCDLVDKATKRKAAA